MLCQPLCPLLADCDADLVKDLGVQCSLAVEQLVTDGLEKAPASCSSSTTDSLGLDALRLDVDHEQPNATSGDQVVQNKIEADELLNSIPPRADCQGHAPDLVVNNQPNSTGNQVFQNLLMSRTHTSSFCPPDNISVAVTANQSSCSHDPGSAVGMPTDSGNLEDQAQSMATVHSCGDQHLDWHQDSYVKVLRRGILAAGTGSPGAGAAPIPHKPITDADQLDALGISNCPEVGVGSAISSSIPDAPSYPQGGGPRQCTNSEQLRRNLADLRQKDAASGAQVADADVPSLVSGQDTSAEGFRLKSILKTPKRPKQKRSPPSNHHF
ncbi:hypothetical protein Nepgr_006875 [Nepenthes gracilis]|uniref:Uncharacterized protein n=1 Tax=Nepenthes gracilis TaxID=150966 RepID=A0AAD3S5X1_NEPGR|nr:hypothetical protein Nepgr_006875 [Nepenthes gracilis]